MSFFNEKEQKLLYGCTQEDIDKWVDKTIMLPYR